MIFVTVGTQLPFDRLVAAVDRWAQDHPDEKVFAQIGPTSNRPVHFDSADFVAPGRANELFQQASLIVSHAGMGSILTALRYRKPILLMPRRAALGEHRNDHQVATAKWVGGRAGLAVAWDEDELIAALDKRHGLTGGGGISEHADPQLISKLREVILAD
ncbi:glycosyltransferase [Noviherbaspirillum aridicola]|uniref:Beta-1,4-galactosyltransferase n=1 Tax=Noviherbaspirillum aridicola TaxID=2849687 RepID=A0ABQ4Q697_9BURK|nr:glycosyltransferase [Noviherbaspirillum aridicola]GIZ52521.1 beta-1,4-galactosyltransferase [Noviherbaspirillum aridicola]